MRQFIGKLILIVGVFGLTANAHAYTWHDVTQVSGPVVQKPESYLKVYSEARVYMDSDVPRVNRVPYTIYSEEGQKLKWVPFNNEDPQLITLPPGQYVIVPETNITKTKVYGAILEQGKLTEVHMSGENPLYAPANF